MNFHQWRTRMIEYLSSYCQCLKMFLPKVLFIELQQTYKFFSQCGGILFVTVIMTNGKLTFFILTDISTNEICQYVELMEPVQWFDCFYETIKMIWYMYIEIMNWKFKEFKHSSFEIQFLVYIFIYPLFHSVLLSCDLGVPYGDLFSHGCKFSVIWWFVMGCKFWHILVVLSKLTKIKWYR